MTANHRPLEEGDIELIDRVRETPCLYDTKDPNFRLVYKKEQEWQAIADSLQMSHWEARKRWTVLRDRYARELKQMVLHPESVEYGKNDFFLRMDFIRNFVKKREVKRKRCNSNGMEVNNEKPRPIKLYKVETDGNSFETDVNQMSQTEKSYIIDDSQDSSVEKFGYVEQLSHDHIEDQDDGQHDNLSHMEEQDYHDYVEDTSVAYEAVEEENDNLSQVNTNNYLLETAASSSGNIAIKPETTSKIDYGITIEDDKLASLPHLQQRPVAQSNTRDATSPSPPIDAEEYFSKTIASYLRKLSPVYKIKAKIEMMQIIEKFIELEQSKL